MSVVLLLYWGGSRHLKIWANNTTVIDNMLSFESNANAVCKKIRQHLFFLF